MGGISLLLIWLPLALLYYMSIWSYEWARKLINGETELKNEIWKPIVICIASISIYLWFFCQLWVPSFAVFTTASMFARRQN